MIKRTTIDNVFETARVEEVIGDFIQLKRSGSNLKGLSPFTDERTPSFMVSPAKQIWKDFSSGKGGNVVSFLMEHEHFNYPEAIKWLAKKYGIEIEETEQTEEDKKEADERESMYLVNEFANEYFKKQLIETEEGKAIGLTYFKERDFSAATIDKFDLGYSPDQWEAFTKKALKKGYQLEFLEKTGLSIVRRNDNDKVVKKFDRFKGRVIFPIHSMSGRILGFGGRTLSSNKKTAKYLNSPESDIYNKSKVLYGIYQAKQRIAKEDECLLVEGYADVIQLHQNGLENTVATSGTALTPDQIRLINRLTKNVVMLFDGDDAGTRASLRGIDLILAQGMNVKVCSFPEGDDPDTFAKKHTEEKIRSFIKEQGQDFIDYKASLLMDEAQDDPIKKSQVIRDMMKSVARIPDDIRQELYVRKCAVIMDISEEVLFSTLAQIKSKNEADTRRKQKRQKKQSGIKVVQDAEIVSPNKIDPQYVIERDLIGILLNYGNQTSEFKEHYYEENEEGRLEEKVYTEKKKIFHKIYLALDEDEIEFTNPTFQNLYTEIIREFNTKQELKVEGFIQNIDPKLTSEITSILMDYEQYKLSPGWEEQGIYVKDKSKVDEREVQQTILNLRSMLIKKKVKQLLKQMMENKSEHHREILENIRDYKGLQVLIARQLGNVIRADV